MPSPFPGMNPYLESPGMWPDFHERLIAALAIALAKPIAPGFYAKIEEQLYIHEHGETRHQPSTLRIFDRHSREFVTVIEVLSPANKNHGPDRDQYVSKRTQYFNSRANLVEIDLLRGGPRHPWGGAIPCTYSVAVCRAAERPRALHWPVQLRERLPVIPIPLRPDVPEPAIDLQALLDDVYDSAGYGGYIYDDGPPDPPLSAEDQAWATAILTAPPGVNV